MGKPCCGVAGAGCHAAGTLGAMTAIYLLQISPSDETTFLVQTSLTKSTHSIIPPRPSLMSLLLFFFFFSSSMALCFFFIPPFFFLPGLFTSFYFMSDRALDFFLSFSPKRNEGGGVVKREADFHELTPSNIDNHLSISSNIRS